MPVIHARKLMMDERPVAARATRTALIVASAPVTTSRTISQPGTRAAIRSQATSRVSRGRTDAARDRVDDRCRDSGVIVTNQRRTPRAIQSR